MGDQLKGFEGANARVFAVLPQEPAHIRLAADGLGVKSVKGPPVAEDAGVTALADPAFTVSATYGVAFQEFCAAGNRPAVFVIDREGVLRWEYRAKKDAADRPTAADVLQVVAGLGKK